MKWQVGCGPCGLEAPSQSGPKKRLDERLKWLQEQRHPVALTMVTMATLTWRIVPTPAFRAQLWIMSTYSQTFSRTLLVFAITANEEWRWPKEPGEPRSGDDSKVTRGADYRRMSDSERWCYDHTHIMMMVAGVIKAMSYFRCLQVFFCPPALIHPHFSCGGGWTQSEEMVEKSTWGGQVKAEDQLNKVVI